MLLALGVLVDLNQYMKNGTLLRQVVNIVNEIEFDDADDRHTFGDIYEGILKDLQSAGNAGEFYTPRALTDFIVMMLDPKLGETFGDFTSGTVSIPDHNGILQFFLHDARPEIGRNLWRLHQWNGRLPHLGT